MKGEKNSAGTMSDLVKGVREPEYQTQEEGMPYYILPGGTGTGRRVGCR